MITIPIIIILNGLWGFVSGRVYATAFTRFSISGRMRARVLALDGFFSVLAFSAAALVTEAFGYTAGFQLAASVAAIATLMLYTKKIFLGKESS